MSHTKPKKKKRGLLEEPAYPVNHQKRIFDRKEASLMGHGFCNRLESKITDVFLVNL